VAENGLRSRGNPHLISSGLSRVEQVSLQVLALVMPHESRIQQTLAVSNHGLFLYLHSCQGKNERGLCIYAIPYSLRQQQTNNAKKRARTISTVQVTNGGNVEGEDRTMGVNLCSTFPWLDLCTKFNNKFILAA
jgi:hypothetical protein